MRKRNLLLAGLVMMTLLMVMSIGVFSGAPSSHCGDEGCAYCASVCSWDDYYSCINCCEENSPQCSGQARQSICCLKCIDM